MQTKSLLDILLRKSICFRFAQNSIWYKSRRISDISSCLQHIESARHIENLARDLYRCVAMQRNCSHQVSDKNFTYMSNSPHYMVDIFHKHQIVYNISFSFLLHLHIGRTNLICFLAQNHWYKKSRYPGHLMEKSFQICKYNMNVFYIYQIIFGKVF